MTKAELWSHIKTNEPALAGLILEMKAAGLNPQVPVLYSEKGHVEMVESQTGSQRRQHGTGGRHEFVKYENKNKDRCWWWNLT